jgi:hypothetical protein
MHCFRRFLAVRALIGALVLLPVLSLSAAPAATLITVQEAALPPAVETMLVMRGITRGPSIDLVSPGEDQGAKSPVEFKVKFTPHNETTVDPKSVKVTYLKATPVDLTARLKPYISGVGIDMTNAEVPPGVHMLRIDVLDSEGRSATAVVKLTVTGQ